MVYDGSDLTGMEAALIGNAASLFSADHGPAIDTADAVVRINKYARVAETHGTRLTHWLMFSAVEYEDRLWSNHSVKTVHLSRFQRNKVRNVTGFYSLEREKLLCERLGHDNPSSGLMAIDLILSAKPAMLRVYGFDWKRTPTWTDMGKSTDDADHRFDLERQYCAMLDAEHPNLRFIP